MTALRVWVLRALDLFVGRRRERRLAEEIAAHLEHLTDDHMRRGLTRDQARAAARRAFGGVDQVTAAHRDQRRLPWLDPIAQDARVACRRLATDRGFTLTATMALALGLAVNNTFFTIVNATVLRGLPIDRPERVLFVSSRDARDQPGALGFADFEALATSTTAFAGIAAFASTAMTLAEEGTAPDRVQGSHVSAAAFGVLGVRPIRGRAFLAADDRPGAPPVAVLSGNLWRTRYHDDDGILGRTVIVNGAAAVVVGVMPHGFRFPGTADLWLPLAPRFGVAAEARSARGLGVFGRLADHATAAQAHAELRTIGDRLSDNRATPDRPGSGGPGADRGRTFVAVPINEQFTGRITDRVWLAFITAGALVLLIACANVANLLLMRSTGRTREMAIRTSLGATRARLVRQLLVESTLLALLGGAVGLGLSLGGVAFLSRLIPDGALPYWMTLTMDGRVFATLAVVCLGSVFVFGLVPAMQAARSGVVAALKDGGRTATDSVRGRRWTTGFLAAELAVTVVLLANVGLGVRQFAALQREQTAIDPRPLLTASLTLPTTDYASAAGRAAFAERLQDRLNEMPGVAAAGVASVLPFGGGATQPVDIQGRPFAGLERPEVLTLAIGARYFAALNLPVVRGRAFTARDGDIGFDTAIVNERFVERVLGGGEALGRRLRLGGGDAASPWLTIVGVAPTVRQRATSEPDPIVYLPYRSAAPATLAVIVRARERPGALAPNLRETVRRLDARVPLDRLMTLDRAMREANWPGRMSGALLHGIASIALILALVGLYAVTAHGVAQRTQEIGVRVTLGARPADVRRLVLRRALFHVSTGLATGVAGTVLWERLFRVGDPAITLADPTSLLVLVMLLGTVSLVACLVPARRAARVDPVRALRQ